MKWFISLIISYMHVCIGIIVKPMTILLSSHSPWSSSSHQVPFLRTYWVSLGLLASAWMGVICWNMGDLIVTEEYISRNNIHSPPLETFSFLEPPERSRAPWAPIPSMTACWLASSYTGLVQAITAAVSSHMSRPCCVPRTVCHSAIPHPLGFMFFLTSLLQCSLRHGGSDMDVPLRAEFTAIKYSLGFDQLWIAIVTAAHCKIRLLSPSLRAALIHIEMDI